MYQSDIEHWDGRIYRASPASRSFAIFSVSILAARKVFQRQQRAGTIKSKFFLRPLMNPQLIKLSVWFKYVQIWYPAARPTRWARVTKKIKIRLNFKKRRSWIILSWTFSVHSVGSTEETLRLWKLCFSCWCNSMLGFVSENQNFSLNFGILDFLEEAALS